MRLKFYFIATMLCCLGLASATVQMIVQTAPEFPDDTSGIESSTTNPRLTHALELKPTDTSSTHIAYIPSAVKGVATPLADILGTYISNDVSYYYPEEENHQVVTIYQTGDTIFVENLFGVSTTVTATYDASAGELTIAPQLLYEHSTYGDCYIYSWSGTPASYSTTADIVAAVQSDGSLSFTTPWGLFVASGAYQGGVFDAYTSSDLLIPNGTMVAVTFSDVTKEYPVLIEQSYSNELKIVNFINNGQPINITLRSDSTGYITTQWLAEYTTYGDFYIYSATTEGKISKYNNIGVTFNSDSISFGAWGVYCAKSTSISLTTAATSCIETSFAVAFPAKSEASFGGEGTADSPYQISTATDIANLAQAANEGETYSGKYFKLTADIDLGDYLASAKHTPIGIDASNYFGGTFDGDGHTIKNFVYNANGELYAGFFGCLGSGATVKNLTFTDASLSSTGRYAGIVAAYNAAGTLAGCSVEGEIEATCVDVGGVVGYSTGGISGCSFTGSVTGGANAGGIVGWTTDTVTGCHANAYIAMDNYCYSTSYGAGGIAGGINGSYSTFNAYVADCYFSGGITDSQVSSYIGGIVGGIYNGRVERCFSTASLVTAAGQGSTGTSPGAGGITGYLSYGEIVDCYNAGVVNAPNCNQASGIVGYSGGFTNSKANIYTSYSSGFVANSTDFEYRALMGDDAGLAVIDIQDAYYDYQSSALDSVSVGYKTTAELTSGETLSGFDTSVWYFEAGSYPRLRSIMDNDVASLSAAPVFLTDGEVASKVTKDFSVSTSNGVSWGILSNGTIVSSDDALTVSDSIVSIGAKYGKVALCAYIDTQTYKYFYISAVPNVFDGEGTASSPYLIKTADDLATLAYAVETAYQSHKGDYFKLAADIDLSGYNSFDGIGTDGTGLCYFDGIFDGDGHTINNFSLDAASDSRNYTGFFGICGQNSVVKNLNIASDATIKTYGYSGAIVGYSQGRIVNCRNFADIEASSSYTGGIVGVAIGDCQVDSCYNSGTITAPCGIAGGIAGYNTGTVVNSRNDGNVVAISSSSTTSSRSGGIVGANLGTVQSSLNTANVTGEDQVGGIAGYNAVSSSYPDGGNVTGCVNTGVVVGDNSIKTTGAIIGNCASRNTIENNYYDEQINPNGAAANGALTGATSLKTATLIAGEAIDGLSSSGKWIFTNNSYPSLNTFSDISATASIDALVVQFGELDTREAISTTVTLSGDGATWSVNDTTMYKISGNTLTVTLLADSVTTDTLRVTIGSATRYYPLRASQLIEFSGTGTETDPYLISTPSDMALLAKYVDNDANTFKYHHFKVVNDINFSGFDYNIVATGETQFQGTFDGNGKTFKCISISKTESTDSYIGLFGYVGADATLKNLTIDSCSFKGYTYAGAFAGSTSGAMTGLVNKSDVGTANGYAGGIAGTALEGAIFEDCVNYGAVSTDAKGYIGGIVGTTSGASFTNCLNEGTITTVTGYSGGIAGTAQATLTGCVNKGTITSASAGDYNAGISGMLNSGSLMTGCVNYGTVDGGDTYIGGLVGCSAKEAGENLSTIDDCVNYGSITGSKYLGGLAGCLYAGHNLSHSENYGDVTASSGYAAGIVSRLYGNSTYNSYVTDVANYGAVTAGGDYVGGIVAYTGKLCVVDSTWNFAAITTTGKLVGGIGGSFQGTVSNSCNAGPISGATRGIGGILGYGNATITGCLNVDSVTGSGTVTARYGMAGGIAGYGYLTITNSYNFGVVTGPTYSAGIMSANFSGTTIEECYNVGQVLSTSDSSTSANIIANYTGNDSSNNVENCYYDSSVNGTFSADASYATACTTRELTKATGLGDAFSFTDGYYPRISAFAGNQLANYFAAVPVVAEGDSYSKVTSTITIGTPEGTTWTASDNLSIVDGTVYTNSTGDAWLTKTYGDYTKTYTLYVETATGIGDVFADSEVAKREYFTVGGILVGDELPDASGVYIERITYVSGRTACQKVAVTRR